MCKGCKYLVRDGNGNYFCNIASMAEVDPNSDECVAINNFLKAGNEEGTSVIVPEKVARAEKMKKIAKNLSVVLPGAHLETNDSDTHIFFRLYFDYWVKAGNPRTMRLLSAFISGLDRLEISRPLETTGLRTEDCVQICGFVRLTQRIG